MPACLLRLSLCKELAEKITGQQPGRQKEYSGIDLKVGGEGMKGFYDKILVDYANKFWQKVWREGGGQKIDHGQPRAGVAYRNRASTGFDCSLSPYHPGDEEKRDGERNPAV